MRDREGVFSKVVVTNPHSLFPYQTVLAPLALYLLNRLFRLDIGKSVDCPRNCSENDGCNGEEQYRVFCEGLGESTDATEDDECDKSANEHEEDC